MEIQSNFISLAPVQPGKPGTSHSSLPLQIGQLLNAKVLATLESNRLLLEINGRRLLAATDINARRGQTLTLEVLQTEPTPRLKTVDTTHATRIITQHATRTLLPQQVPLDQALAALKSLYQQPQTLSALPPAIRLPLAALLKAIPKRESLANPAALPALLSESGIFHEAMLAQSGNTTSHSPPHDLKAHLLRLSAAIKAAIANTRPQSFSQPPSGQAKPEPTPHPAIDDAASLLPQMEKDTASALARLVLDQLASLPKNESSSPGWHFEIPYFHGGTLERLRLTIAQESPQEKPGNPDETAWSVILELAPEYLGKIQIKITTQGERIHTYFWSEKASTRQLFEKHFDHLQSQLQQAGLDPKVLQTAKTVTPPQPPTPPNPRGLINVTT